MENVVLLGYDENGNLVSFRLDGENPDVPGSANNVRLCEAVRTLDAKDRPTSIDRLWFDPATQVAIDDGHSITQIAYTDTSQVEAVIDDLGRVRLMTYDGANRLSQRTDPKNNTVTLSYDGNSAVIGTTEVDKSDLGNPDLTRVTTIGRDNLERTISATDSIGKDRKSVV